MPPLPLAPASRTIQKCGRCRTLAATPGNTASLPGSNSPAGNAAKLEDRWPPHRLPSVASQRATALLRLSLLGFPRVSPVPNPQLGPSPHVLFAPNLPRERVLSLAALRIPEKARRFP